MAGSTTSTKNDMAEFHQLPQPDDYNGDDDGNAIPVEEWDALNDAALSLAKSVSPASLPSMSHATSADFQEVYEPSDDTYLLLDALQHEVDANEIRGDVSSCLEIGCGSGAAIVGLAKKKRMCGFFFATDVNPRALEFARRTARENGVEIEFAITDLAEEFVNRDQKMDVVIFNPPYVPTSDEEVGTADIAASWAGGADGRRVVDRALPQIAKILRKPNGACYLITVDDNRPRELAHILKTKYGLRMAPLLRRRAQNERLTVQKITWMDG